MEHWGKFVYQQPRVPHISPVFGEMWELADLKFETLRHLRHTRAGICHFPHLAKNRRDMGHPRFVVKKGSDFSSTTLGSW